MCPVYNTGGIADNGDAVGDITNHHRPSTYSAPLPDFNTGNYDGTSAHVGSFAYFNVAAQCGVR